MKSVPDAYLNTVVVTRNLLDAAVEEQKPQALCEHQFFLRVFEQEYNAARAAGRVLRRERNPTARGDAYCFARVGQDRLIREYVKRFGIRS